METPEVEGGAPVNLFDEYARKIAAERARIIAEAADHGDPEPSSQRMSELLGPFMKRLIRNEDAVPTEHVAKPEDTGLSDDFGRPEVETVERTDLDKVTQKLQDYHQRYHVDREGATEE